MNNNKKIIIVLTILLIIAIGAAVYFGYFKDKTKKITSKQTPKVEDQVTAADGKVKSGFIGGKKSFTDASDSYSLEFSKDWVVVGKDKLSSTGANYNVAIINKNDPTIFIGINGPQEKDKDYESDLVGLMNALIAKLKEGRENYSFEVIEQDFGTNDKFSYTYLVSKISSEEAGKTVYQMQKNIISSDKLFVFTASCSEDKFEDYEKDLKEIIDSFELK